jgi:8-oxoguanine deaminase
MIQEVRQSLLQQRLRYGAEVITAERVLGYATTGSAAVLKRPTIGMFNIGMQADLAIFSLDEMRFSGVGSPLDGLITCGASHVEKLMVGGKWQIENTEHCALLSRQIMKKHQFLAKKLQNHNFVL